MSILAVKRDEFTGQKLGRYELICRLSVGGMAEIFLGLQAGLGGFRRLVVIKQVRGDLKSEVGLVEMFLEEAKVTAGFTHPDIAQVFDLDATANEIFLVM